jgi:hypothetical protein
LNRFKIDSPSSCKTSPSVKLKVGYTTKLF